MLFAVWWLPYSQAVRHCSAWEEVSGRASSPAKKAEKSGQATVCLAKAKEGRGSPWNSPWVKSDGEN